MSILEYRIVGFNSMHTLITLSSDVLVLNIYVPAKHNPNRRLDGTASESLLYPKDTIIYVCTSECCLCCLLLEETRRRENRVFCPSCLDQCRLTFVLHQTCDGDDCKHTIFQIFGQTHNTVWGNKPQFSWKSDITRTPRSRIIKNSKPNGGGFSYYVVRALTVGQQCVFQKIHPHCIFKKHNMWNSVKKKIGHQLAVDACLNNSKRHVQQTITISTSNVRQFFFTHLFSQVGPKIVRFNGVLPLRRCLRRYANKRNITNKGVWLLQTDDNNL